MQLKCPACNAGFSLDAALAIDAGRSALHTALEMPGLRALHLAQYLGLFRAAGRALAFDRVERLLLELKPMLDAQIVTRNGLTRPCPTAIWQRGIERVLELRAAGKLDLPLKTHGYLLEIVYAIADSAEAKAERQVEESRRRGEERSEGDRKVDRYQLISRVRGDVQLGLLTREQGQQALREAGINPEVLDG